MLGPDPTAANPIVVAWARAESGYDVDRAAKSLQVKPERIVAWESGKRQPTPRQIEKLAHLYRRPLGVFFLQQPPEVPPLGAEYRRLPNVEPGQESPELRLALRQMLIRRENALNLMGELGEPVPEFRLKAHLREKPEEVGRRLREALGIDLKEQRAWPNEWRAWAAWRRSAERIGVLVFVFSRVKLAEVRGMALLRRPLPVAAINSKEIPESKAYTLLHETVHVMLAAGDEEKPALKERRPAAEWNKVERFAEFAASRAMVPEQAFAEQVQALGTPQSWDIESVRRLARRFRVTPLAAATRLRESRFMTWEAYRHWREQWNEFTASLPPRRGGIASPAEKAVNRAGRPFAQLVLEALAANRITSIEAARYLELRFDHLEAVRSHLGDLDLDRSAPA
ncbi:MAG: XRE family transcriptional regulator [Terriglobales bacterium]